SFRFHLPTPPCPAAELIMQGDRKVIDDLNGLRHELTAINQYCEKHQPDVAQWLGDPSEGETRAHCQYAENDKNQHGNRRSLAQQVHQHCCPRYTGLIGLTRKAPAQACKGKRASVLLNQINGAYSMRRAAGTRYRPSARVIEAVEGARCGGWQRRLNSTLERGFSGLYGPCAGATSASLR